jgi:hypothetical protein
MSAIADDAMYIESAKNLKSLAMKYLKEKKPDKITIIYNCYKIILENINDKSLVKEYSDYFVTIIKKNNSTFCPIWITVNDEPLVVPNTNGLNANDIENYFENQTRSQRMPPKGWTHRDLDTLFKKMERAEFLPSNVE